MKTTRNEHGVVIHTTDGRGRPVQSLQRLESTEPIQVTEPVWCSRCQSSVVDAAVAGEGVCNHSKLDHVTSISYVLICPECGDRLWWRSTTRDVDIRRWLNNTTIRKGFSHD